MKHNGTAVGETRQTWAVILSGPMEMFAAGFGEQIDKYHPFFDPAKMTLRFRVEVGRLEIDGVGSQQYGEAFSLLHRAGHELAWRYLGRMYGTSFEAAADLILGEDAIADVSLVRVDNYPVPEPHGCQSPDNSVRCPRCQSKMVARHSGRGPFYGCSNFPECKGTRRITQ